MERDWYKILNVLNTEVYVPLTPYYLPARLHGVTDQKTAVCTQNVISVVIERVILHLTPNMRVLLQSGWKV
jgi:hypothetical protein